MSAGAPPELSPQHDGHESDRLQKLLDRKQLQIEVGNAVVSKLTLQELLVTISKFLKEFIHHDVASVVLYDEQTESLRVHALDKPAPMGVLSEGTPLPMEGSLRDSRSRRDRQFERERLMLEINNAVVSQLS